MKQVMALILVCALVSVSAVGHPIPAARAAGEVLYVEIPQDSYCRAPATTVYLPIMMGNLSTDPSMLIRSVEVLDAKGQVVATERTAFKLESLAGKAGSSDAIRTALGIIPPAPADIATAQSLIAKAASTTDSKQKSILVEQAFFASRAKQSMKSPEELTADEAKIQQLLKPVALAVDLPQSTVDTTCETAVPVTVRITGELSGQPFTLDQQTMVYLLTSLPNGGMWHPGDGHVHTAGLAAPDSISQYTPGYEESYGYSDATDGASVLGRRNDANSKGMQWVVITDHAGDYSHQIRHVWIRTNGTTHGTMSITSTGLCTKPHVQERQRSTLRQSRFVQEKSWLCTKASIWQEGIFSVTRIPPMPPAMGTAHARVSLTM